MRTLLLASIGVSLALAQSAGPDYEKTVLPVLRGNCFPCHSAANSSSGLALDSKEGVSHGGIRGPADKFIVEAIRQTGALKMPPSRQEAQAGAD
jgi:hypothetical protein